MNTRKHARLRAHQEARKVYRQVRRHHADEVAKMVANYKAGVQLTLARREAKQRPR